MDAFVDSNMVCATYCEDKVLWTEKKKIVIPSSMVDSASQKNESLQLVEFENKTYEQKTNESGNIFINEISYPKFTLTPKDPATFTL